MSKIHADRSVCEGIGMCETQADEYFMVDDDGFVEVLREDVDEADRALDAAAVASCPVAALKLGG